MISSTRQMVTPLLYVISHIFSCMKQQRLDSVKTLPENQIHLELIELTKKLIRIPSTSSRRDDIHQCADFISQWLKANNIDFDRHSINDVPSISVLPQPGNAPLLVMSHFDVVEVKNTELFEPWIENGCLFGRGSIDDKYAVALSLILFREHLNVIKSGGGNQQDMQFGLLLSGDEETGGANGVGALIDSISTDFCIAIDGGGPELIVDKEKGILQLKITATGKASHGARPWLGENAFDNLVQDYRELQTIFFEQAKDEPSDHWYKTMVLSNLTVGNGSINVVPDRAEALLDIRYTEHDDPDAILASIERSIKSKVEILAKEPVFATGPSSNIDLLVRNFDNAIVGFEHGASDARYLSQRGIPGVIVGAEGNTSQHTENEHIVLSSLYQLYDRLDTFFHEFDKEVK